MQGNQDQQPVSWVTGASSGIGREITLLLARQGHRVIASARNEEALIELAQNHKNITILVVDVTSRSQLAAAVDFLEKTFNHVDTLIVNAGSCEYMDFPDPDWRIAERMMAVNFHGAINCIEAALPLLRRGNKKRGHIVGIGSQAIHAPFPRSEAYGASKAALAYFLNSLRIDLSSEAIDVSVINPGFVDTPLTRKNDFDMPFLMNSVRASEHIIKQINKRVRQGNFPRRLYLMLFLSKLFPGLWQKLVSLKA